MFKKRRTAIKLQWQLGIDKLENVPDTEVSYACEWRRGKKHSGKTQFINPDNEGNVKWNQTFNFSGTLFKENKSGKLRTKSLRFSILTSSGKRLGASDLDLSSYSLESKYNQTTEYAADIYGPKKSVMHLNFNVHPSQRDSNDDTLSAMTAGDSDDGEDDFTISEDPFSNNNNNSNNNKLNSNKEEYEEEEEEEGEDNDEESKEEQLTVLKDTVERQKCEVERLKRIVDQQNIETKTSASTAEKNLAACLENLHVLRTDVDTTTDSAETLVSELRRKLSESEHHVSQLTTEKNDLEHQIKDLESKHNQASQSAEEGRQKTESQLQDQISALELRVRELQDTVDDKDHEINTTRERLSNVEEELRQAQERTEGLREGEAQAASLSEQIRSLNASLMEASDEARRYQSEAEEAQASRDQLATDLDSAQDQISTMEAEVEEHRRTLASKEEELHQVSTQLATLEREGGSAGKQSEERKKRFERRLLDYVAQLKDREAQQWLVETAILHPHPMYRDRVPVSAAALWRAFLRWGLLDPESHATADLRRYLDGSVDSTIKRSVSMKHLPSLFYQYNVLSLLLSALSTRHASTTAAPLHSLSTGAIPVPSPPKGSPRESPFHHSDVYLPASEELRRIVTEEEQNDDNDDNNNISNNNNSNNISNNKETDPRQIKTGKSASDSVKNMLKVIFKHTSAAYSSLLSCIFEEIDDYIELAIIDEDSASHGVSMVEGGQAMSRILNTLDKYMELMVDHHIPKHMVLHFYTSLMSHIDAILFNRMLNATLPKSNHDNKTPRGEHLHLVSPQKGINIKMNLSYIENWLDDAKLASAKKGLGRVRQAADVCLMPKATINTPDIRNSVCPSLSNAQLARILKLFVPDEISSEKVPSKVIQELGGGDKVPAMDANSVVINRYQDPSSRKQIEETVFIHHGSDISIPDLLLSVRIPPILVNTLFEENLSFLLEDAQNLK